MRSMFEASIVFLGPSFLIALKLLFGSSYIARASVTDPQLHDHFPLGEPSQLAILQVISRIIRDRRVTTLFYVVVSSTSNMCLLLSLLRVMITNV